MRWCLVTAIAVVLAACSGGVREPGIAVDSSVPYVFHADRASEMGGSPHQVLIEQNGQLQTVLDWDCYWLERVEDFDHDNLDEALIGYNAGCGGNCCGSQYLFVDVASDGAVRSTEWSVSDWAGPDIVETEAGWRITVVDPHAGFNSHLSRTAQTFTLAEGRLVELDRVEAIELPAIAEIRSESERTTQLVFDLDADGHDESIECTFWDRWGVFLQCSLSSALGEPGVPIENLGGKRVGVLASTTSGWHDLVADFDAIYRWDGETYVHDADG